MRLIDADALLDKCYYAYPSIDHYCTSRSVVDAKDIINAQTIDAEPIRHGHWIVKKSASGSEYTICGKCGLYFSWRDAKFGLQKLDMRGCDYCPHCGADMRGENNG